MRLICALPLAPPVATAAQTPTGRPVVVSLAQLSQHRPSAEILAEVKEIGAQVHWDRWFSDIERSVAGDHSVLLLALGPSQRIVGFQILTDHYVEDVTGRTVRFPGPFYAAYLATRPDAGIKGVGKALFLELWLTHINLE